MSLHIIEEKENKLFKRKEIRAAMESEITPSRNSVLDLLSKKFSVPSDNIKIKSIKGNFGMKTFTILANIYQSAHEKDALEVKKKKEGAVKEVAKTQ